jgi:hypothetical protein
MTALSEDSIDWVTALHKRNQWSPSCPEIVKRVQDCTPDIHNEIFFRIVIADLLQALYDPIECSFLFVSPFRDSARVRL